MPLRIQHTAPEGMIRIIGRENGLEWHIGDFDENLSRQEIREKLQEHAGVGIDIEVVDENGRLIQSA